MPRRTRNSIKSHLGSGGLDKKLIAYAVAGGAALSAPVHAGIIDYGGPTLTTDIHTTDSIQILLNGVEYDFMGQIGTTGTIANTWSSPGGGLMSGPLLFGQPVPSATFGPGPGVFNQGNNLTSYCAPLPKGTGCMTEFRPTSVTGIVTSMYGMGFAGTYFGLEFQVNGQNLYGWVELTAYISSGIFVAAQTSVQDYAYQTTPGATILAGQTTDQTSQSDNATPEPSTLALFALGATGVAAVRRRRTKNV